MLTILLCIQGVSAIPFSLFDSTFVDPDVPMTVIPDYVTKYAPVVHLYSEERYLPGDINEYVTHFVLTDESEACNLTTQPFHNLSHLTQTMRSLIEVRPDYGLDQSPLFLSMVDDFSGDPDWVTGRTNIPNIATGLIENAPAVLIVVNKGHGIVDAFWFFFYAFNLGPFVMGAGPYGNHIGDWEHCVIRFDNGNPQVLWMSAHGGGAAYQFEALEKSESDQNRPVIFAARGTHANYATVGQHSHDLPYHMLSDFTDRGPLWDVSRNYLAYIYDGKTVFETNGTEPGREIRYGNWMQNFQGHWGNKQLPPEDPRQRFHPFSWRMIDGPTGPLDKNLMRNDTCQRTKWWNFFKTCHVRNRLQVGEGIESEGAHGCALLLDGVRPYWLQIILRLLTFGGFGCFFAERIWG